MIVALVQARTGSTRFPGKVLAPLCGKPLLRFLLERLARSRRVERTAVATTTEPADDALAALAAECGVDCRRGDRDDVLDRMVRAARDVGATHVVRVTGDCPLVDPGLVDRCVDVHLAGDFDLTTNARPGERTFPDGLDVEVARLAALETAAREARLPSEREHVTPYLYAHPNRFRIGSVRHDADLSRYRWTVDEPVDLDLVRTLVETLSRTTPDFAWTDVLALCEARPELALLNAHVPTNEGYRRSLEAER